MNLQDMSQMRRRAWLAVAVWAVAGVGFFLAFFSGGGAGDFADDSYRHLATAGAVAFGFVGWWAALWLTRRPGGRVAMDERDLQVAARAGQATLVVVLVAIYAFTVGLWTLFEGAGAVPVGWMWFLAYASVILASLTNAMAVLVLDGRMGGRG